MPVLRGRVLWTAPGGTDHPELHAALHLFDIPLAVLIGVTALEIWRHRSWQTVRWRAPAVALVALLAWSIVATVAHPSWRAVEWYFHVAGAAAVAHAIARFRRPQLRVALSLIVGFALVQGVFGIAQSLNGGTFGWGLVEYSSDLIRFAGREAAKGSFGHPYHLAAMLLVGVAAAFVLWAISDAVWQRWCAGAIFVLGLSVAFTFSRASVVGLGLVALLGFVAPRGRFRWAAIALVAGLLVGAAIPSEGWEERAAVSVNRETVDSGRVDRLDEARSLIEDEPVFGVGTGRYVIQLSDDTGLLSQPAHNAVLHAGGEMGIPGLLLAAALLVALGWWGLRGGILPLIVGVTLAPLHLLDAFPYSFPRGLVLTGVWVGLLVVARRSLAPSALGEVTEGG